MDNQRFVTGMVPLEAVRYNAQTGLVPVVVQHAETGAVLTLAYANREALKRTLATGQAWFWSRSRQEYWRKGATSGNTQTVVEVILDCDGDAVLYRVVPAGPACHTGADTCFYRTVTYSGAESANAVPVFGPGQDDGGRAVERVDGSSPIGANSATPGVEVLKSLWSTVEDRWTNRREGSYTTYLFTQGIDKVAKKVGEEAVEVALAAKNAVQGPAGRAELVEESADLLYHLLVLWKSGGITPDQVFARLAGRRDPQ